MTAIFADSAYYLALLNARDQYHDRAKRASAALQGQILTTTWVLTEVADASASRANATLPQRF
jgi:predicted nucleic acid-binding protein